MAISSPADETPWIKFRSRACKPKVRTGCFTCKRRRVKCDEAKPECRRCLKLGVTCRGYEVNTTIEARHEDKTNEARQLLPRGRLDESPCLTLSEKLPFRNEVDERYFREFFTKTAISLIGGPCETYVTLLWTRIIMQTAHEEHCLQELVTALGAVTISQELRETGQVSESDKVKQSALQRYGTAIRVMNLRLSKCEYEDGTRKALIGCLLISYFEGILGNTFAALRHAQSGNKVMHQWIKMHRSNHRKAGVGSPAPYLIEDEIVQFYTRIDEIITTARGMRKDEEHEGVLEETSATTAYMPTTFSSNHEARTYLELIERRAAHFGCLVARGFNSSVEPDPVKDHDHDQEAMRCSLKRVEALREVLLGEIQHWAAALDRFSRKQPEGMASPYSKSTVLIARSKVLEIMIGNSLSRDLASYNKYLPQFQTIVNMCESALESIKDEQGGENNFDFGIIMPLHTTAEWCQDSALRYQALALIRAYRSSDCWKRWCGFNGCLRFRAAVPYSVHITGNNPLPSSV
ncbi:hypothetical protein ACMFMG_008563 [Clarireedia jacksonii]